MSRNLFGVLLITLIFICIGFYMIYELNHTESKVTVVFNAYESTPNGYTQTAYHKMAITHSNNINNIDARALASEEAAENNYVSDSIEIVVVCINDEEINIK